MALRNGGILPHRFTLKMEAAWPFETLVSASSLYPEDGSSKVLRNVGIYIITSPWRRKQQGPSKRWYLHHHYTVSQPRRPRGIPAASSLPRAATVRQWRGRPRRLTRWRWWTKPLVTGHGLQNALPKSGHDVVGHCISYLGLGLPSGLFSSDFPSKILYGFTVSSLIVPVSLTLTSLPL